LVSAFAVSRKPRTSLTPPLDWASVAIVRRSTCEFSFASPSVPARFLSPSARQVSVRMKPFLLVPSRLRALGKMNVLGTVLFARLQFVR
jgi:hypothetical protein